MRRNAATRYIIKQSFDFVKYARPKNVLEKSNDTPESVLLCTDKKYKKFRIKFTPQDIITSNSFGRCNMSGKFIAGIVGGLVGVGVIFGVAAAFFNSKKMKMKRAIGRAGNTMYNIGSLLCGMSTLLGMDGCERA